MEDDIEIAAAGRLGRLDVLLLADRHDISVYQLGDLGPAHDADDQNDRRQRRPDDRDQAEDQDHAGEGHEYVRDPHDHRLHGAPVVTRQQSQRQTDRHTDGRRCKADKQRHPAAGKQTCKQISADRVGAQPVGGTRRGIFARRQIRADRIQMQNNRQKNDQQRFYDNESRPEHRPLVFAEVFQRLALLFRFYRSSGNSRFHSCVLPFLLPHTSDVPLIVTDSRIEESLSPDIFPRRRRGRYLSCTFSRS